MMAASRWMIRRLLCHTVILALGMIGMVLFSFPVLAAVPEAKKVLILHSYDSSYPWTERVRKGIRDVFVSSGLEIDSYEKFMDMKRVSGEEYVASFKELLRVSFKDIHFDVIVTTDNDALNFMRKNRDELFPGVPLVFCGINDFDPVMLDGRQDITGVVEANDYQKTLEAALIMRPMARRVVIVTDESVTGQAQAKGAEDALKKLSGKLTPEYFLLNRMSIEEMAARLKNLDSRNIVLLLQYFKDKDGRTFSHHQSTQFLTEAAGVPCFVVVDTRIGLGVVGGMVSSGENQGKVAGSLAVKILNGSAIQSIPVILQSPNRYLFDQNVLTRFRIPSERIPPGSTVINRPESLYARYKWEILIASAIFLFMLVALVVTVFEVRRRTRAEKSARDNEKKLRALYGSMSELVVLHEVVRDPAGMVVDYRIIDCNDAYLRMAGVSRDRIIGALASQVYLNPRPPYLDVYAKVVDSGTPTIFETYYPPWERYFLVSVFSPVEEQFATVTSDITDLKRSEDELKEKTEELERIFNLSEDLICVSTIDGKLLRLNPAWERILGYELNALNGKNYLDLVHPEDRGATEREIDRLLVGGKVMNFTNRYQHKQGDYRWLEWTGAAYQGLFVYAVARDVTVRKDAERRQQLIVNILNILNAGGDLSDMISAMLVAIKKEIGFDAVGIRLRSGHDCPYYVQEGFSKEFLRVENTLCVHNEEGLVECDADGVPILGCTCGLVLSGKTDPQKSFFTPGGSFWTNDASLLLGLRPDEDPRYRPRNRCVHEGHRSVALIPIRVGTEIAGLLQLNDSAPGRFSLEVIKFWEGIGSSIGVALTRRKDAENIKRAAVQWQSTFDAVHDAVFLLDVHHRILQCNKSAEALTRKAAADMMGQYCWEMVHGSKEPVADCPILRAKKSLRREVLEMPIGERVFNVVADPIIDGKGFFAGVVHVFIDITERKKAEESVLRQKELLDTASESAEVALWQLDIATGKLEWAGVVDRMLGYPPGAFPRTLEAWEKTIHPDDREWVVRRFEEHLMHNTPYDVEYRIRKYDGSFVWWRDKGMCLTDPQGRACRMSGACLDVTERKMVEIKLEDERELLRTLIDNMPDSVYVKDKVGRKIINNRADLDFMGIKDPHEVIGKTDAEIYPSHLADQYFKDDKLVLDKGLPLLNREEIVEDKGGVRRWLLTSKIPIRDVSGRVTGLIGIGRDITERKMLESKLLTMAHYDTLTQLPNRTLFLEKANMGLAHAKRAGTQCALLFIDLDHFKSVNDTLGHSVGDELLRDSALKLAACIRETDVLARLGGDEFIVLLNDLEDGQEARHTAERIREQFNAARIVSGNDLFITASTGIAVFPNDGETLEELLKHADTAMYAAKEIGRNMYCFFDGIMNKKAVTKMQIERGLREALAKREFSLFYQPIVSVSDGRVRGFEALLRWFKTEGGLVFPDEFIPVAEETGLIIPIGEWVLREACRVNKRLMDQGCRDLIMSVNVSVAQLRRKNIVDVIQGALEQSGLPPEFLEIEITESMLIESFEPAVEILNAIRALGVQISLDDFGTGYSSLVHLQKLPIVNLKIDRFFIKEISREGEEKAMIPAIIDLAHKLNLSVVAEGVETDVQLAQLAGHRCDFYQGFFLSRPMPEDEVPAFLRRVRGSGSA